MLTIKEFSKKWNISSNKVKKMIPFIEGAEEKNGTLFIPDDAKPLFVKDKRRYRNKLNKDYLFILDAVASNLKAIPELIEIREDILKTKVRELKDNNLIILIEGHEDSLSTNDYCLSLDCIDWINKNNKEKFEIIYKLIETITTGISKAIIQESQ